jgi:hypothetical protein
LTEVRLQEIAAPISLSKGSNNRFDLNKPRIHFLLIFFVVFNCETLNRSLIFGGYDGLMATLIVISAAAGNLHLIDTIYSTTTLELPSTCTKTNVLFVLFCLYYKAPMYPGERF